ncbi:hypothetical protein ABPG72_010861 [Tetrahymena utriculariae]
MKKNLQFQLFSLEYCISLQNQYKQAQTPATLKSVEYKCQIINNILKTTLSQTFVSQSSSEYSETIYYFPIINCTCLEFFEARYNQKIIKGIIKEKQDTKKEYQENKKQGNFVSYAETSTKNDQQYCEILLGNLPPNQQVEINIVFSQQLSSILNKYYVATILIQYCEDEISAKIWMNVLTLELLCTGKITYAESRGQKTEKTIIDDNTIRFNLSQALIQIEHEFQLVFSFEGMFEPQIIYGSSRIFHEDSVKRAIIPESNSVMVSFIPNFNEEITQEVDDAIRAALSQGENVFSQEFQQKVNSEIVDHLNSSRSEFIFLLDRSGSMNGQPIQQACEALILFLKSLPTNSYFNVVSFGYSFEKLFPSSQKYNSQNLEKAIEIIAKYSANLGGTEIYKPLLNIFNQMKIEGYNKQIFLLTDGQVDYPQKVVGLIKQNNKFNRVHSIGFGSGADKYLIKETAASGKGISKIVNLNCDLSEVIIEILSLCITPTFDEFKISYDKNIFQSTYPSCTNFPCIFKDEIINIHLFFKPLKLMMVTQDSFSCNLELQQSVFKIGKQLQLNEMLEDEQVNTNLLLKQSIDYQILTKKTALICVIETLNDQQKAELIKAESASIQQTISYNYQSSNYAAAASASASLGYQQYLEENDAEEDLDMGDLFDDFSEVDYKYMSKCSVPQKTQPQQAVGNLYQEIKKCECDCENDDVLGDLFDLSYPTASNSTYKEQFNEPIKSDKADLTESDFNQIKNKKDQNIKDLIQNQIPKLQNLLKLVDSEGVKHIDDKENSFRIRVKKSQNI